jgi:hypothetical protein
MDNPKNKYRSWYLDLVKISYMGKDEQEHMHFYYREMLKENNDDMTSSFFLTLKNHNIIKIDIEDCRDQKLEELIDG